MPGIELIEFSLQGFVFRISLLDKSWFSVLVMGPWTSLFSSIKGIVIVLTYRVLRLLNEIIYMKNV